MSLRPGYGAGLSGSGSLDLWRRLSFFKGPQLPGWAKWIGAVSQGSHLHEGIGGWIISLIDSSVLLCKAWGWAWKS